MYIPFQTLAQELARNVRLQQYSFGPQQIIMGIDLLPIPCDPATAALNERVAYLCEYWQIPRPASAAPSSAWWAENPTCSPDFSAGGTPSLFMDVPSFD